MAATRPVALLTGASSGVGKEAARALAARGPQDDRNRPCDLRTHQDAFDINIYDTMRMTKAVPPHMRTQRPGRVINVSSLSGFVPSPFMSIYTSTKRASRATPGR